MISLCVLALVAQCQVHSAHVSPRVAVPLLFEDGTTWGSLQPWSQRRNEMTATFDAGGMVRVNVSGAGQQVSARVNDLDVYLGAPHDFGWGFTSSAATPLHVDQVTDAGVLLSVVSRADAQPFQAMQPLKVGCSELRLEQAAPQRALGEMTTKRPRTRLFDRRGGQPTFDLAPGVALHLVQVRDGYTQVVALLDDGSLVTGWAREVLRADPFSTGSVVGASIACGVLRPPPRSCSKTLHLHVTDGARVEEIGTLDADEFFDVQSNDGDFVEITPRELAFSVEAGWRLVVRATDLEQCSQLEAARSLRP